MMIDRDEIESLIPHSGTMCLLETVERWDDTSIQCSSATHLDEDNPLRRDGRLGAVHAMEYGAQAAAIHGALLARDHGEKPVPGYLAALRDVRLAVAFLDRVSDRLDVTATLLTAGGGNQIYDVQISAADREIASGRVMVMAAPA